MPLYTFRRPPDPIHRQLIAPLAPSAGSQVDTAYTVGTVIPTAVDKTYTLGGEVQAPVDNPYTVGGEVQAPVVTVYTLGGSVKAAVTTQYQAGGVVAFVVTTTYTMGASVKSSATTQYTMGAVVGAVLIRPVYPLFPGPYEGTITTFVLCDAFGKVLHNIGPDVYLEAEYGLAVNSVTPLTMLLPSDFDYDAIHDDGWVLPMRKIGRSPPFLDGEAPFLVTGRGKRINENGGKLIELHAENALSVANRRIVAYSSEGAYGHKIKRADQFLYEVMTENFGAAALDATRNTSYYLSFMAPTVVGWVPTVTPPTIDLQISRARCLDAMVQGAQTAAAQDFEIFFDVVMDTQRIGKLRFNYYFYQRGKNRTRGNPGALLLSTSNGTLSNVAMLEDFSREFNLVYARGQGSGDNTLTTSLQDGALVGKGPFARKEQMYTSNQTVTPTSLVNEGYAALRQGRPKQVLTADIPGTADYGRLWRFGDRMNAEFDRKTFAVHAQSVNIHISDGKEDVRASLRAEVIV